MDRLETERLILRRWEEADLHDLHRYARDPQVGYPAGWQPHTGIEESGAMLQSLMKSEHAWAIVLKETNRVIGHIKLTPNTNKGRNYAKSVSYALSRERWGRGFMTEALGAVVKYAFEEIHVDMLTAFRYPENISSGRVLEKCGFELECTLPGSIRRIEGSSCDAVCYLIEKEDYGKT